MIRPKKFVKNVFIIAKIYVDRFIIFKLCRNFFIFSIPLRLVTEITTINRV